VKPWFLLSALPPGLTGERLQCWVQAQWACAGGTLIEEAHRRNHAKFVEWGRRIRRAIEETDAKFEAERREMHAILRRLGVPVPGEPESPAAHHPGNSRSPTAPMA
jgi:hypothetical protein